MIKEFIAKLFGIETYFDVAMDLYQENEQLKKDFYEAYTNGKRDANYKIEKEQYERLQELCDLEEIEIEDLVDILGEDSYETDQSTI